MTNYIGIDRISKKALSQATQKLYSCDWSCTDFTNAGYEIDNIILANKKVLTDSEKTTLWDTYLTERQAVELLNKCYHSRQIGYTTVENQLDMLFHDMTAGKGTKDGEWYKAIAKVKTDNPKPTE